MCVNPDPRKCRDRKVNLGYSRNLLHSHTFTAFIIRMYVLLKNMLCQVQPCDFIKKHTFRCSDPNLKTEFFNYIQRHCSFIVAANKAERVNFTPHTVLHKNTPISGTFT